MLRFALLAVLFSAVCAIPIGDESSQTTHGSNVVENIDEYLAQNP